MEHIVHMRDDSRTGAPVGSTLQANITQTSELTATARNAAAGGAGSADKSGPDTWQSALKIVSEESGLAVEELSPDAAFDDLRVDLLLSLLRANRFREELGLH